MKKILFAAAAALAITSCSNDLSSLNGNVKAPESVPAGALFANATMGFYDYAAVQDVNQNNLRLWSQHWTQTTYVDESNFDLDNRDVNGATFWRMYGTVVRDCEEARTALADVVASTEAIAAAEGAIEVMEVLAFSFLVDLFGDVPYTEALSETNTPVYDDDAAIYNDLLARLDAAAMNLSGTSAFGSSDIIYGGDAASWKMAAHSLMLRLAIRMIDADPTNAQMYGEKAIAGGVFASSADDMRLFYSSAPPHTHPMWETLVQSGRTDYIASNTLGDVMNANNDPRRAAFFKNLDSVGNVTAAPHGLQSDYYQFSQPAVSFCWDYICFMNNDILIKLQHAFNDSAITRLELESFEKEHSVVLKEDWLEYDETGECYFLSPEVLEYDFTPKQSQEALGLGELEDRIVDVLEQGKSIPWGRVAIAMWIFFLFIVAYTVIETSTK